MDVTMARRPKKPLPATVRQNCNGFLKELRNYDRLLRKESSERCKRPGLEGSAEAPRAHINVGPARRIWDNLDKYGRRLLVAGKAWQLHEWVATHQEWKRLETAGFFDGSACNRPVFIDYRLDSSCSLSSFLACDSRIFRLDFCLWYRASCIRSKAGPW